MSVWAGRRVWISGASTGIGAALAAELAAHGARIALTARSRQTLEQVAASLPGTGHLVLPADVVDAAALRAALDRIVADWGGIDLVVVNAGTHSPMRGFSLDVEAAGRLVDVNLKGAINQVAAAVPTLLAQRVGHIAVVASVAGYRGLPQAAVYGPTKAALINFAEALRLDLGPRGVKVQVVNPGFVKTPLTDRNDFRMPALISAEEAAREIRQGLESRGFEIHFPKRFTRWLKLLRVLPYVAYFPIVRRMTGV